MRNQFWKSAAFVLVMCTLSPCSQDWPPGPYPQTFVIDGHRTHYLAFGATWVRKGGLWVPTHTARNDPVAQHTSLYAWSLWAAAQDRLPPLVCGTSVTAAGLQAQVFGPSGNPW